MKLVIRTKRHVGDHKIHQQGVQFEAYFINHPTDTAEDFKAIHELSNIVKADCNEAGWYFGYAANANKENSSNGSGCHKQRGETPYTPRELVLKARATSAENLARAYKRQIDEMRLVMVRSGLSCAAASMPPSIPPKTNS